MARRYRSKRKSYKKRPRRSSGYRRVFKRRFRRGPKVTKTNIRARLVSDRTQIKFHVWGRFRLVTDTTIGAAPQVLWANSCKDPLGTASSSQQPTGFDEWGYFYENYYVRACKIKGEAINLTGNNCPSLLIFPNIGSFDTAAEYDIGTDNPVEYPYAHQQLLATTSAPPTRFSGYMTTRKMFPNLEWNNEVLSGQMPLGGTGATNPASLWYWNICALNQDNPASACTVVVNVKMTLYCTLSVRRNLSSSKQ